MAVEVGGPIIDGIDDDGARTELLSASHTASQGIDEKASPGTATLNCVIQSQAREQHHGHGIRHASGEP